jgi:hypothetical protein
MLLNDVGPERRLGYLLGVQVERYVFGGKSRLGVGLAIIGVVLLLLVIVGWLLHLL